MAQHVMLEKTFRIGFASAPPPECFLPWRERAAEVEGHRRDPPDNREEVDPEEARPSQDEERAEHDECDIDDVYRDACAGEQPPNQIVTIIRSERAGAGNTAGHTVASPHTTGETGLTLIFIVIGFVAGILSGVFGIGGGLVIVPALILISGLTPIVATGTSLGALLLPVGALGAWEYYRRGNLNIGASLWVALGLLLGAWIGAQLAHELSPVQLRRGFSIFLVLVAGKMWFG